MQHFQPSSQSDYGIWPFDTLSSWLIDEKQAALAQFGVAAGQEIYDQTPSRMSASPASAAEAYEQAIYWLSVARRRADYEDEDAAASVLSRAITVLQGEQSTARFDNPLCATTGWFCSAKGMSAVLQYAIDSVGTSGLNAEDQTRVLGYLKANQRGAMFNQAIPYIVLVGIGAAAGTWWYYRK